MKNLNWIFILFLGLSSTATQSYAKLIDLNNSADTVKILAVMVEFQADKYDATTGTGKFGSTFSKDYGDTIIDPLPHNAEYFSDHLLFAKNYYQKVSKGKLEITYKVLPTIITLPKYMRDYSLGYKSNDLTSLGKLAQDVWTLVDQQNNSIKFSDYNCFMIFHAGVGAGLDLGTFSVDRNLPSLYLGSKTFKEIFGSSFSGFATKTGKITNTIILPETESREQDLVDGTKYLNQVSINGIIVNNIGNYLGLPDLFNTESGLSAIGKFGLMDGQAIAANFGMFPPSMSPWEKMYLGWETPVTFYGSSNKVNIATRETASLTDTTLLKIPINSAEYFLIENRQQDALKNNAILTIKKNGKIYTKTFPPDTSGYYFISPDSLNGGVVIDVDELDAAVPGNGIVIWHIDERVINSKFAANTINNDRDNLGVGVVEADGVHDIGYKYDTPFGTVIGEGTYQDLWYKGNKTRYYTNKFGVDTKPSSKSNSGSNSNITMESFSSSSNKMAVNISYGPSVKKYKLSLSNSSKTITQLNNGKENFVFITDNGKLYKYNLGGEQLFAYDSFSTYKPAAIYFNGAEIVAGVFDNKVNLYIKNSTQEFVRALPLNAGTKIICSPAFVSTPSGIMLYACSNDGSLASISVRNILESKFQTDGITKLLNQTVSSAKFSAIDNKYAVCFDDWVFQNSTPISIYGKVNQLSYSKNSKGEYSLLILRDQNRIEIYQGANLVRQFTLGLNSTINTFSLTQIDNSGENNILVNDGNQLKVFNMFGKLIENFPVSINSTTLGNISFSVDLDNSNTFAVVTINSVGDVYYTNNNGKILNKNSILNVGADKNTIYTLFNNSTSTMLASLDSGNILSIYNISEKSGKLGWVNYYGDEGNSNSAAATLSSSSLKEFFPVDKAYNWPNPVYENSTNFRFYVGQDASYKIKIVDLSGSLVSDLEGNAIGETENEVKWDVSKIQSGVYYAYLEVNSSTGSSANKIIKVAVIK